MITKYNVTGITCGHCVHAIKEEVRAIPGVSAVELDLAGAMAVHSDSPIEDAQLTAALAEAGDDYAATQV
jgi:copper chaperone CopZ